MYIIYCQLPTVCWLVHCLPITITCLLLARWRPEFSPEDSHYLGWTFNLANVQLFWLCGSGGWSSQDHVDNIQVSADFSIRISYVREDIARRRKKLFLRPCWKRVVGISPTHSYSYLINVYVPNFTDLKYSVHKGLSRQKVASIWAYMCSNLEYIAMSNLVWLSPILLT